MEKIKTRSWEGQNKQYEPDDVFTGFFDIDGKELFENDLCTTEEKGNVEIKGIDGTLVSLDTYNLTWVIIMHEGHFCLYNSDLLPIRLDSIDFKERGIKKIGNAHDDFVIYGARVIAGAFPSYDSVVKSYPYGIHIK